MIPTIPCAKGTLCGTEDKRVVLAQLICWAFAIGGKNVKARLFLTATMLALATPAFAEPIHINPYGATVCEGSWDGPGKTTCELIGATGQIGVPYVFTRYSNDWTLVYSLTAHEPQSFGVNGDGSLYYSNPYISFNSHSDTHQFAYWESEQSIVVGVEDLTGPSDWDYNDYVVEFSKSSTVPEPSLLVMLGVAFLTFARRVWKGEIL